MLEAEEVQQKVGHTVSKLTKLKGLIVPHAGYLWSGPVASFSYCLLSQVKQNINTIFVLGLSHYAPFKGCAMSKATVLETPLGNLEVD